MHWKTSKREIDLTYPRVMAILNVTPDSFSDGGRYSDVGSALKHAEQMIFDGADIIDIGGESTRPGSSRVSAGEEISRIVPVIEALAEQFDIPISVDTSKSQVARAALDAGAEIINDISGLRFDPLLAQAAAGSNAGLVLMHSRGEFESMHSQPPVDDILADAAADFRRAIQQAKAAGVGREQIVLDVGIGFGKTVDQNLELIAKLDKLIADFPQFPMLVGTSRKSFIGKLLNDVPPNKRSAGSLASAAIAVWNGARIVRVHDVKDTVEDLKVVHAMIVVR
ncbi:MAG: dihydropteroate synthase [Acidobacteria bacterium]|nr:dihydropteroate synthase [Acidobacteriota bacterium]